MKKFIIKTTLFLLIYITIDLVFRQYLRIDFETYPLPKLPLVQRHSANRVLENYWYGELSYMIGNKEYGDPIYCKRLTDQLGFTNGGLKSLNDSFDILVLGNSHSYTEYYDIEETQGSWVFFLQKKIGHKLFNLSIQATGLSEQNINLQMVLSQVKVKNGCKLLWCFMLGDVLDHKYNAITNISELPYTNFFTGLKVRLENFKKQSAFKHIINHYFDDESQYYKPDLVIPKDFLNGEKILFFRPYYLRSKRTVDDIKKHSNFKLFVNTIEAVNKFCEANSIVLNIILIPSKSEVYPWVFNNSEPWIFPNYATDFAKVIKKICGTNNINLFDLTPYFRKISKNVYDETGNNLYFNDDTHLSYIGHFVTAKYINSKVLSDTLLVLDSD